MVFLVNFRINLHSWVFQKAEIALTEVAHAISAFWKTHSTCNLTLHVSTNPMHSKTQSCNLMFSCSIIEPCDYLY